MVHQAFQPLLLPSVLPCCTFDFKSTRQPFYLTPFYIQTFIFPKLLVVTNGWGCGKKGFHSAISYVGAKALKQCAVNIITPPSSPSSSPSINRQ